MNKKLVLAFSGGMDSSVLLHMAIDRGYTDISTVTFDYGQRHSKEMIAAKMQLWDIEDEYPSINITNKVLDVKYLKSLAPTSSLTNPDIDNPDISKIAGEAQPVSYVPFRNQMFLTICCSYAESLGIDTIWYGAAQIDSAAGYWDCSQEFIDQFNALLALNRTNKIYVEAPLLALSKADIVKEGVRLGVDFLNTWTCYSNRVDGLADATTPSSSLRVKGFIDAGVKDPIQYVQQDKLEELYKKHNCIDYNP